MTEAMTTIGVDLGGTKIEIARVNQSGAIEQRVRVETDTKGGPPGIQKQIVEAVFQLEKQSQHPIVSIGIGVAGQIEAKTGVVKFAPNLPNWHHIPLKEQLQKLLNKPVFVTNDVRAATWGEWHYGAGKGCQDLVCVFVGTGVGGGVVSGGQLLTGCTNSAGELGHVVIDFKGPPCTCGNSGCLEAFAGGWAIARQAKEAIKLNRQAGAELLELASPNHEINAMTAKVVAQAYRQKNPLAITIIEEVEQALIAGTVSFVNAFNPCRLIFGGGLMEGFPHLLSVIEQGVKRKALPNATHTLECVKAQLGKDSGVIGAAGLASELVRKKEK